ncbi:Protein CMSS1, partial [Galemys pyrenaicus]
VSDGEEGQDAKIMPQKIAPVPVLSKKAKQPKECFLIQSKETKEDATKTRKRRKKKITDILAKSEPKPGTPEDLQKLMKDYYSSSRSVIELEDLNLPVCPKWAKLWKNHNEKKSVLMLIICSSAIRALELIRSMTAFRGNGKVMKLFAKHIKIQEQVTMLEKRVVHLGVGTPGRIKELVKQGMKRAVILLPRAGRLFVLPSSTLSMSLSGGLNLNPLKFLVFDWNWRDQKLRRMMDIPEVLCNDQLPLIFFFNLNLSSNTLKKIRKEVFELLEIGVLGLCKSESLKLGLF